MTTYNITLDEHSSKARHLLSLIKEIAKSDDAISIASVKEPPYNSEFVAKINKSEKQFSQGKFKAIKTEDLWK